MAIQSESTKSLNQDEHNEAAHAKRVVPRYLDPTTGAWTNFVPKKVAGVDYDYLDVQQTDSDTETFVFKDGGSGGTTVLTIVVNYTDSTKSDIDNVSWT